MSVILVNMWMEERKLSTCTFFGHRDCPEWVRPKLRETITELILQKGADVFYVGNQGAFDRMVRGVLRELTKTFPHIRYAVVLAYMPNENGKEDYADTILPEGIETIHRRYAISHRNRWLVQNCDIVICYVTRSFGGAAQFVELSRRQYKTIINLAE